MKQLEQASGPATHLVFLGTGRPGLERTGQAAYAEQARELARREGLEGRLVHFKEGWVPYAERARWLAEADLGVSAHLDHLEARFSFRTRILDYLWAGLPVVTSAGDALGDLVERERARPRRAARATRRRSRPPAPSCSTTATPAAEARERIDALAPSLRWSEVTRPLADWCEAAPGAAAPRRCGAGWSGAALRAPVRAHRRGDRAHEGTAGGLAPGRPAGAARALAAQSGPVASRL